LITGDNFNVCNDGKAVKLTASTGSIKSPGFDELAYPDNALCRWIIKASPGKVRNVTNI